MSKLRIAKIGAGQCELLPFAAGEIDAALEAAAQHLIVAALQLGDYTGGQALLSRILDFFGRVGNFNAAHGDVFARRHLVAHEVLEDDADLRVQIVQVVFAQIDAIEQNLAFGRIVEPRDELDDGGLALAVFADERDALAGAEGEVEVAEDAAVGARIGEGDVAEFKAARDRLGRGQSVRPWTRRAASSRRRPADR